MSDTLRAAAKGEVMELGQFEAMNPGKYSSGLVWLREALAQPEQRGEVVGMVLVPKRMTRKMQRVVEREEWEWADLLAAAGAVTEAEHSAILDAPPAPVVPEGWKLVPVEPTYGMVQAGAKLVKDNIPYVTGTRAIYKEMLAAAPTVAAKGVES